MTNANQTPTLTYKADGLAYQTAVRVDLQRLVASRMLIQANSGGGKSRAARQLLEETHGRIQHLVIDPEGEFSTLREKFDYVHAAKTGGDVLASPKTAKLLCRRLVELGASAVLDLYELTLPERREFVELFLTELVNLPRSLWRPILVFVDEAHTFAPQSGEARSLDAMIALCTLGRKRGFAAVFATQRISKLHKDAAAELNNKLIGRTGLDVDVKRAGDELGFDKDGRAQLMHLQPGEFFAYGPAIASVVTKVRTGAVVTTHPEPGQVSAAPTAAPAKVKAMLAQLVDLPKEAEAEARTVAELQRDNATLKAKVTRLERAASTPVTSVKVVVDQKMVDHAVNTALKLADARLAQIEGAVRAVGERAAKVLQDLRLIDFSPSARPSATNGNSNGVKLPDSGANYSKDIPKVFLRPSRHRASATWTLGKGERQVMIAIASYADGVAPEQLTTLTGYKRSSRNTYLQRLSSAGYIERAGDRITATDAGVEALGSDYEPLPSGEALRDYWMARLTGGELALFAALVDAGGFAVDRESLGADAGYERSSRNTYLQRLRAHALVVDAGKGRVMASPTLFDGGR